MSSSPSLDRREGAAGLPAEQAFVLQFRRTDPHDPAAWIGRIEHVASGAASKFASFDEVVTFVRRVRTELVGHETITEPGGKR